MRSAWWLPCFAVLAACGDDGVAASATGSGAGGRGAASGGGVPTAASTSEGGGDAAGGAGPVAIDLATPQDEAGEGRAQTTLDIGGRRDVLIDVGDGDRILEIEVLHGPSVAMTLEAAPAPSAIDVGESAPDEPEIATDGHWFRPRPVASGTATLHLVGEGEATVTAFARGAPVPAARRERSLVWTDAALLDDPSAIGLAKVLASASDDDHGGVMLDRWFRRFATTAHSERAAPATLMNEIAAEQGDDPADWDLDALPFRVTGIHNRLDLAARNGDCGELRVSFGSTDPVVSPLHVLFLFRQLPREDDVRLDQEIHCLGTARRWSRLAALDDDAFLAAARAWIDDGITHGDFALAETVELTVSPWEWRQWKKVGPDELDNPPLFQTVATPLVNAPGALRDAFLDFVRENADGLDARQVLLPQGFASPSAQAPPSAPAERLDLDGIDPAVLASHPNLARNIEITGCPTCHTEHAEFVQTSLDRTFSPFYDAELDARARRLDRLGAGLAEPTPPYGPLQDD